MDGVAIMLALLADYAPLTALVPATKIMAGTVPQNVLPAVGIREISSSEMATASGAQASVMVTARIQVTVYAATYPTMRAVLNAAKLGPGYHTGLIAGVDVRSVSRDFVGPDLSDISIPIYEQSRDFRVVYIAPN